MNGSCPRCGGSDRELIAPGYWECTSSRIAILTDHGPQYEQCHTRYQEAGGSPAYFGMCSLVPCGTAAIGACATCNQAVCGERSHSSFSPQTGRICRPCSQAIAVKEEQERLARASREHKAQGTWLERVDLLLPRVVNYLRETNVKGYPAATFEPWSKRPRIAANVGPIWIVAVAPSLGVTIAVTPTCRLLRWGRVNEDPGPVIVGAQRSPMGGAAPTIRVVERLYVDLRYVASCPEYDGNKHIAAVLIPSLEHILAGGELPSPGSFWVRDDSGRASVRGSFGEIISKFTGRF